MSECSYCFSNLDDHSPDNCSMPDSCDCCGYEVKLAVMRKVFDVVRSPLSLFSKTARDLASHRMMRHVSLAEFLRFAHEEQRRRS